MNTDLLARVNAVMDAPAGLSREELRILLDYVRVADQERNDFRPFLSGGCPACGLLMEPHTTDGQARRCEPCAISVPVTLVETVRDATARRP